MAINVTTGETDRHTRWQNCAAALHHYLVIEAGFQEVRISRKAVITAAEDVRRH